jgi:peptidoglycan/LPS O-acetylase OafA/YrhL
MDYRLYHLDGLRGLAALLVMIHHTVIAFDFALYSGRLENSRVAWDIPLSGLPFTIGAIGDLSVCIFFLLSGYVLSRSFSRTRLGIPALVIKRYVRLGVPIFVIVLLSWALIAAGAMDNAPVARLTHSTWLATQSSFRPDLRVAVEDGLYGALLLGHSQFDTSLWTMPIEFQGSMILILTFTATRWWFGTGAQRNLWSGGLLLLFAVMMHGSLLLLFGVGAAAYIFDLRGRTEPLCRLPPVAATFVFAGLLLGTVPFSAARPALFTWVVEAAPIHYGLPWRRMDPESFWHAVGALLLLVVIDGNPSLRNWLSSRPLRVLGEVSFPLYLVHLPVLLSVGCSTYIWLLTAGLPIAAATVLAMLITWVSSLLAAGLLNRTVERSAIASSIASAASVQAGIDLVRSRARRVGSTAS